MRGIESHGMLLAADYTDANGKACVEPLEAPWATPGTKVILQGSDISAVKPSEISADDFFAVELNIKDHTVNICGCPLTVDGRVLTTQFTANGEVH